MKNEGFSLLEKKEAQELPVTVTECIDMIKALKDQLSTARKSWEEATKQEVMTREEAKTKMAEIDQSIFEDFIKGVLKEAERYQHIFITENGSFYFVLKTGESMRLKSASIENGKAMFSRYDSFYPLMRGIVFLSPDELDKQKEKLKYFEYSNSHTFETVPLGVGAIPFEYEANEKMMRRAKPGLQGIVEWDESHTKITLRGWPDEQETDPPQNFNGYPWHRGHSVTRVIK